MASVDLIGGGRRRAKAPGAAGKEQAEEAYHADYCHCGVKYLEGRDRGIGLLEDYFEGTLGRYVVHARINVN